MTTEEKFHAAVNVIRNLPKNGSYQPSHELMLRFYAFFKQATLGPCNTARPGFWDPVGRYKYDAHKALGNMPKEQAMRRYVEELHSIVETLSYSEGVKNFLEAGENEIDSVDFSDLEKIAPDVMKRVRSQSNSPMLSREPSPERPSGDSINQDTDVSDDEYSDTVEVIIKEDTEESKRPVVAVNGINHNSNSSFTHITNGPVFHKPRGRNDGLDISVHVLETVDKMKREFERIENRMYLLENETRTHSSATSQKMKMHSSRSMYMIIFMVGWPFLASLIMHKYFLNRKAWKYFRYSKEPQKALILLSTLSTCLWAQGLCGGPDVPNHGLPPVRLTFHTARQLWDTVHVGHCLFVALPSSIPEGSRESFLALLEAAEEQLKCQYVILVFEKTRPDLTKLIHTFMFLGFTVLSPTATILPPSLTANNVCMLYRIE